MSLHEMVLTTARQDPARVALIDGPSGATVTYGALAAQTASAARALAGHEIVALWAPNVPAWASVALGAMAAGGAVSPIGPAATPHEVARAVRASGASLLVTIPPFAAAAREAAGGVPVLEIGPDLLGGAPAPAVDVDAAAIALVPFSSGTTGTPKPIPLTHANLVAAVGQMQSRLRFTSGDVVLAVAPFAHIMGSMLTLAVPLSAGATVVTVPRFDLAEFLSVIERHRVTILPVAPPLMRALAFHPLVDAHDLSSVELIACGGAPLPPALQEAVARRFPHVGIGQGYGMTETSVAITCPDRASGGSRPGTVGTVVDGTEIRLVDGELHVRGPQVIGDGWLATGDLVEIDDDGAMRIVGRLKDLIKVSGYQVAPAELEELMLGFGGVEDAAVVGVPDEERGEAVVAFVVGGADPGELGAWLAERVAGYKRPREIRVVQSLPRTPSGKLLRRVLVEELRAVTV